MRHEVYDFQRKIYNLTRQQIPAYASCDKHVYKIPANSILKPQSVTDCIQQRRLSLL